MSMSTDIKDVVVIGGGIVGTAILRALSFGDVRALLIESEPDVCEGTSKANSGIVHTGFDAPPGSIEAECIRRARSLWPDLVADLHIPYVECGAVMVACDETERNIIADRYVPNAQKNGVPVQMLSRDEVLAANPAVASGIAGGLRIAGEAIVDPFWATRAFAELAVINGAQIRLNSRVTGIRRSGGGDLLEVQLEDGESVYARYVVNAAGLWSDEIARMVGDDSFTITPRKGQFLLIEEPIDISSVILPVPTPQSKGVLLAPVVFGGYLLGPTAENGHDKWDRSTTEQGIRHVRANIEKLVPGASSMPSIRQFAGVRAVSSTGDFIIRPSEAEPRLIHAAGIRSTGVTSSPGIAERVVECLLESGLKWRPKQDVKRELPAPFADSLAEPGEIVCLCRMITRSEVERVKISALPCRTLDGIKRRTGAMLGECQGNYCIPNVLGLLDEPLKGLKDSYIAYNGKGVRP